MMRNLVITMVVALALAGCGESQKPAEIAICRDRLPPTDNAHYNGYYTDYRQARAFECIADALQRIAQALENGER